ncbi:MAG: Hcp family type VI secretion system effector, partial [Solirubrobacteraceae bacterium]
TTGGKTIPAPPVRGAAGPTFRIIDPSAGQTCATSAGPTTAASEANLTWNALGRQGPPGQRGPTGKQGLRGRAITVIGGNTLTLPGGNVVTVGSSRGVTIVSPPLTRGSKPIGTLTLGSGSSAQTFEIFSWSFGAHNTGGGGGTGKANVHEIEITKKLDKSSPKLAQYCATGKHISKAKLVLRKAGGTQQVYLKVTMDQAIISSYQTGGSGGGATKPTESFSLNFSKIEFKYNNQ